jgi:hypothetical protein
LIGGPGETYETMKETIEKARRMNIALVGIAVGVRVYPHTSLHEALNNGIIMGKRHPETCESPGQPIFYVSSLVDDDLPATTTKLINKDKRFMLLSSPSEGSSYNYTDDRLLYELIRKGSRGAYWDILRKNR